MQSIASKKGKATRHGPSASTSCVGEVEPMTPGKKRKLSGESGAASATEHLPSAPNGAPLAKKKKMSPGPNYLGSLREAGRSVMTLLGEGEGSRAPGKATTKTPTRKKSEWQQSGDAGSGADF
jgi:hypothetical protein